jgi:Uma2 family endonuclease
LYRDFVAERDRLTEMQERVEDYFAFGVSYVWLIDPKTRKAYVYSSAGIREVRDGVLTTENPNIRVVLDEL